MAPPFEDIDENRLKAIQEKYLGNRTALICIMNVADIFIIDLKAPK